MTIAPIGTETIGASAVPESAARSQAPDFANWLTRELADVNSNIANADMRVRQLAVGETTNIHQVMISLEKARMSLELVVQVRNKCLESYQSLMQMQI
jgi:flagellar hook-basal body complex protein FliE